MKKIYIAITALFTAGFLNAQMLTPTVIASAGGFATGSGSNNFTLSYTVGEMTMVETFNANGIWLTQGFQQPNDQVTGLLDLVGDGFGSFVVYPNPAVDNVWYGFELPEAGRVSIAMYNAIGQNIGQLYQSNYDNGKIVQQTNVSTLAAGLYMLTMNFTSNRDNKEHVITKKFQVIN
ncbi:MAG: T9SS type A sorting domain-containing protein [Bacteroidetes bacterium]|nr:T9SS type A sorting domain-containing protein [Bacteroidota bacterium]